MKFCKRIGFHQFQVKSSGDFGRYLVASRDLQPGDLVLTERPLVFGPKAMPNPETVMPCVGCYKPVFTDVGERCAKLVFMSEYFVYLACQLID